MEQNRAIELALNGDNLLITGKAGTGKTYIVNKIIQELEQQGKNVARTALTGIASTHIRGRTIHSWSGIGISDKFEGDDLFKRLNYRKTRNRIRSADVLIIDEISMMHDYRFDLLEQVMSYVRQKEESFGDLQIIVCGDFFQLPPVSPGTKTPNYTFNSKAWKAANFKVCHLDKIYRQSNDLEFIDILNNIRCNSVTIE